jgi:P2 family phage contractile tail tube protein
MALEINKLLNASVYADNKSLLGKADEVKLPDLKFVKSDHAPLGLAGKVKYPGQVDAMEGTIKWNCFYADVYKKFANPYKSIKLTLRGVLDTYVGSDRTSRVPYVVAMTINSDGVPAGNIKAGDNAEFETAYSATYLKVEVAGEVILEFDAVNNIHFVDGVDLLKEFRQIIGQ